MKKIRPISPFLSIYRPQVGSIFSIFERITGVILAVSLIGLLVLAPLRSIALSYYGVYSVVFLVYKGSFSLILVSGTFVFLLFCLVYHLLFSCRFIFWGLTGGIDKTFSLDLVGLYKIANLVLAATTVVSLIIWLLI